MGMVLHNETSGKRINVGFAFSSGSAGGAERRYLEIAKYLSSLGHDATVMVEDKSANLLAERLGHWSNQLRAIHYPWWVRFFRFGAQAFPRIHRLVGMRLMLAFTGNIFWGRLRREEGIDVMHVSMSTYLPSMVGDPHVFEITSPDWAQGVARDLKILTEKTNTIAVSETVAKQPEIQNNPVLRVYAMKNMFPVVSANEIGQPAMHYKERIVVFGHRFIARKNPVVTAIAAAHFLREFPEWTFHFLGLGPEEQVVRRHLTDFIEGGRVEIGYRESLSPDLRRSKIFVSVIERDNYPSQSVAEAMANANALLLSNRGESRRAFFNSNGILVEPDVDGILHGLRFLVSDEERLEEMGWNSYRHACQALDRSLYIKELLEVYRRAMSSG